MTERQALKLSGLHDEVRRKALDMGFTPEQVETALIVTGGKTFKVVVDFLLKESGMGVGGRKRPVAGRTSSTRKEKDVASMESEDQTRGKGRAIANAPKDKEEVEAADASDDIDDESEVPAKRAKLVVKQGAKRGRGRPAGSKAGNGESSRGSSGRKAKSGFELFFLETKDDILASCKGESFGAIQKRVKSVWEGLSPSEREDWHEKAAGKKTNAISPPPSTATSKGGGAAGMSQSPGTRVPGVDGTHWRKFSRKESSQDEARAACKGSPAGGARKEPEKRKVDKKKMDSHDVDPSWLGHVPDAASLKTFDEDCFKESTTLHEMSARALEQINADKTMQSFESYSQVKRCGAMALPALMHKALIRDWELVTRNRRVYQLPSDWTVRTVTTMYSSSADVATSKEKAISCHRAEFAEGLCNYFDSFARARLLYNAAEMKQFDRLRKQSAGGFVPSDVYGAEHLIRLLAQLPDLLAAAEPGESEERTAVALFHDFVKFFSANFATYVGDAEDILRMF